MSVRRAQDERIEGTPDGNTAITAIMDVPDAPTIGAVSDPGTDGYASVAFTAATTGGTATSFTATSSPGNISGTGASSPIIVTGLTLNTSYTFTVTGTNSTGTGTASAASASFTPTQHTAFESIATVTASGGESALSFTSIPSTYKHLQVRGIGRRAIGGTAIVSIRFNSDTANNYAYHQLEGNGANVFAVAQAPDSWILPAYFPTATQSANIFGGIVFDILDYANTSKFKTLRSLGGYDANGSGENMFSSGLWRSTSAITSVTVGLAGDTFNQYSSFALYGIKG